jgi:Zn-dependent M28 family amino/carboxypeptidase
MKRIAFAAALLVLTCSRGGPDAAAASVTAEGILNHIRVLASDEFEGRLPGTKGEELTVGYLVRQFETLGLEPAAPGGSYTQPVPLVGYRGEARAEFIARGRKVPLKPLEDFVAVAPRLEPLTEIRNSPMVFVGYGVEAPEYGWDDYKGADLKGKTLVMLINDPPVPDPKDPSQLDPAVFKGRAMTYYGRWTYKYEIAAMKGAAAAVIVHETGPAGYPWDVVRASWGGENFEIRSGGAAGRVPIQSWITLDKARQLLAAAGQDFDALKRAAVSRDFKPVPLAATAGFTVKNTLREVESHNVIGRIQGREKPGECVVYTAHWDHLGRDPSLEGDQIFNGALDNASGVGMLLEIARAFTRLRAKPRRTILFAAVTAEEQGLLGAKYYVEHPVCPLAKTLADINIDGMNQWGRTRDLVVVGLGNSTLDDLAAEIARGQGRQIKPDAEPEKGYYYRADHFEFAKQGVPAFYIHAGTDYIDKPPGFGEQKRQEFTAKDYHKPSDEIKPDWDLAGAVEDARLLFLLGYRVAEGEKWPEWKPGTEFRARREAMLR